MTSKYSYGAKRAVILLFFFLGSLLISVDGQNQMRNVFPFEGIAYGQDIIVTTTSDLADFEEPQMIENLPGPDSVVSLREALIAANNEGGRKVIAFNIPLSDAGFNGKVFVIQPESQLPALRTDNIKIDGTTQTDFAYDTNPEGPEIVLDGTLAGFAPGILIEPSNGHKISGLVIHSFGQAGIQFQHHSQTEAPNHVKITKCYIGTDETGILAKGNYWEGIAINGNRHVIGGSDPEDANLISGNGHYHLPQISITGEQYVWRNTIIQGNLIGTDRTGQIAFSQTQTVGIGLSNSRDGVVKHNLISGCDHCGITVNDFSENNLIENNMIGTDISGRYPLPNECGILITASVKNTIADNIISFNRQFAIGVEPDAYNNRFTRNSIFSNEQLGIDLGLDGVTLNDPGDLDEGANRLMNFPLITSVNSTNEKLIVKGKIDTKKSKDLTIEIFANAVPDRSGYGEGAIYLGSIKPTSNGKFEAVLPKVPHGTWITATATDANGSTSEFSLAFEVQ